MTAGHNTLAGTAAPFLRRIETIYSDLDSLQGEYMARCKTRRTDIKSVYVEAKDQGVPTRALKGLVRQRKLERKIKAIAEDFDIDEASAFKELAESLGELGMAAAVRAGYGDGGEVDVRPEFLKQQEADKKAAANEAALGKVGRGRGKDKEASAIDAVTGG